MIKPLILAAAAAALFGHTSAAFAQANGRTSVGSLTFTLIDLDPNDGITPSLVFDPLPYVPPPGQQVEGARLNASYFDDGAAQFIERFGSGNAPLMQSFEVPGDVAISASLSGRGTAGTHQIELAGFADANGINESHSAFAHVYTGQLGFVLSPNTGVTFSLIADVEASVLRGAEVQEHYQSAIALYVLMGTYPNTIGFDNDYIMLTAMDRPGSQMTLDVVHTLSVSYENRTGNAQTGFTSFDAWASVGSSPIPVIPEPGVVPMLLAGLMVVGAACSRRHPGAGGHV